MRVPLSWLADFVALPEDWREVARTLDDLGLVVEGVEETGVGLEQVVVAEVLAIDAIPGADRIRRVEVDAGSGRVQVVCGAWNFAEGDLVALAPPGTVLPGGVRIERRRLRGVESAGMLCSARELGLGEDQSGLLILGSRNGRGSLGGTGDLQPGQPLAEALGEGPDVVLDVAVETNRPDALSIVGIARDLAARWGQPLRLPEVSAATLGPVPTGELCSVVVEDPDLCPRFTAWVLTEVTVRPSPALVARRLRLAGMRAIDNVVDASNYVMLELGQPTHPYDLDALAGPGLRVRAGRPGEEVVTLDGQVRRLGARQVAPADDRRDCVICDAEDRPVGVAGVMGGASSQIGPGTRRVLLEAAYFDPMAVARTSARLALRSEASVRFERGCDPAGIERAVGRLVTVLGWSVPELRVAPDPLDVVGNPPGPRPVRLRLGRLNGVLGTSFEATEVRALLDPLGFASEPGASGEELVVTVPSFRPDASREIDVVEEVARLYGYRRLPRRRFRPDQVGRLGATQRLRRVLREALCGLGCEEAWTPSLLRPGDDELAGLGPGGVVVANPLTPEESVLRRSLRPGLLRALAFNRGRQLEGLRLFELGRVFPEPDPARVAEVLEGRDPERSVLEEREVLAVALAEPGDDARAAALCWTVLAEATRVVGVTLAQAGFGPAAVVPGLHPTRSAWLTGADGAVLGALGEVDPAVLAAFGVGGQRVGWLELDLGVLRAQPQRADQLVPASRFPASDVDLAFVVGPELAAERLRQALQQAAEEAAGESLEAVALFDVYQGPPLRDDQRSLAFRLRFRSPERTLRDEEVAAWRAACIEAAERLGARLR